MSGTAALIASTTALNTTMMLNHGHGGSIPESFLTAFWVFLGICTVVALVLGFLEYTDSADSGDFMVGFLKGFFLTTVALPCLYGFWMLVLTTFKYVFNI